MRIIQAVTHQCAMVPVRGPHTMIHAVCKSDDNNNNNKKNFIERNKESILTHQSYMKSVEFEYIVTMVAIIITLTTRLASQHRMI